jgi:hypothetical protein
MVYQQGTGFAVAGARKPGPEMPPREGVGIGRLLNKSLYAMCREFRDLCLVGVGGMALFRVTVYPLFGEKIVRHLFAD